MSSKSIDYRSLLKRFVRHVVAEQGEWFVTDLGWDDEPAQFTKREVKLLRGFLPKPAKAEPTPYTGPIRWEVRSADGTVESSGTGKAVDDVVTLSEPITFRSGDSYCVVLNTPNGSAGVSVPGPISLGPNPPNITATGTSSFPPSEPKAPQP